MKKNSDSRVFYLKLPLWECFVWVALQKLHNKSLQERANHLDTYLSSPLQPTEIMEHAAPFGHLSWL